MKQPYVQMTTEGDEATRSKVECSVLCDVVIDGGVIPWFGSCVDAFEGREREQNRTRQGICTRTPTPIVAMMGDEGLYQ